MERIKDPKKITRPPGSPKVPDSGRVKGTLNKATVAKQDLYNSLPGEERYRQAQQKLWDLGMAGSVCAIKGWLEDYYRPSPPNIDGKADTFEDLDKTGEHVVKEMLIGKLDTSTAKEIMSVLLQKREIKAGAIMPLIKEFQEWLSWKDKTGKE